MRVSRFEATVPLRQCFRGLRKGGLGQGQDNMQPPIGAPGAMRQTPPQGVLPAGSFKLVHQFDGSNGQQSQAGLINVNGTLYGTTKPAGGKYDSGTVFST